ncbi:MutS-related protein [Sorangium atrum]|uniref:DNA mismatch repair protein n=1 Tax=Sorangium atrum TaxID=2995308 RepID=A0ABT5BSR3_9BACT|nr:DNA mismatch repair protein [Sorangium aterium]MDC0677199.1 DNA mismatch repair protein [Sorangium aterium]
MPRPSLATARRRHRTPDERSGPTHRSRLEVVSAAPPEPALPDAPPGQRSAPDLLSHRPALRVDARAVKESLAFAFAGGAPAGAFDRHVESASLPASTWDPARFAQHVFLRELIVGCLHFTSDGRSYIPSPALLGRALSQPPSDRDTVELRRAIFRELTGSEAQRRDLERAYAALRRWVAQLETIPISRGEGSRRRLDILAAAKDAFDALAGGFAGARSGLSRLSAFGAAVRETEAYRRLADLLAYDEEIATLDVRIRVGSDGHVRDLRALSIRENSENRFYQSPLGRFVTKLVMLWRGYRFSDDELLTRHVNSVFDGIEDDLVALVQLLGDLEFYLAGLALRARARAAGLAVCLPEFASPGFSDGAHGAHGEGPGRELKGLFNPLLLASSASTVPCDIATDHHDATVIVTGPNSGGKTRLLEALSLAQMMGQAGFFVPAAEARLSPCHGLFVSLIEQAQADQSEGRLGMELLRIRSLFEAMQVGDMVVLDELCSGTNPSEGEEIFQLVISLLSELRPQAFITTHFLELAARLERERPVDRLVFLQVELDAQQWPTYQFVDGVARTSLAHRTAARLGVTREELVALVERSKRAHRRRGVEPA